MKTCNVKGYCYQKKPSRTQVTLLLGRREVSIVPNLLLSDVHVFPVGQIQAEVINRLGVCYNNVLRIHLGVPPWSGASSMFVMCSLRSLQENLQYTNNTKFGIESSCNCVLFILNISDVAIFFSIITKWKMILNYTL